MKKYLLLIVLSVLSQLNPLRAQTLTASPDSLFFAPDTVCVNQPVSLKSNVFNASSYYWGFCSGYLMDPPTGVNIGSGYDFHKAGNIDIVLDNGNYYGFVVNDSTTEFLRLNFGNSLSNIPTVTNFGNLTNGLPVNPTSLFILHDTLSGNWFVFVSGGFTGGTSQLGRVDFGPSLNNPSPNVANFGNYANVLNGPKGIFIAQAANGNWFGYLVNHNTSELIRLDFSFNVSNTPLMYDLGNVGGTLTFPTDMAGIYDAGQWHLFATNEPSSVGITPGSITRIDLGTTLDTVAAAFPSLGHTMTDAAFSSSFNNRIIVPSSISLNRDCGDLYAYVTDSTTNQLIKVQISTPMSAETYTATAVDYNDVGFMSQPSCISSVIRDHDNLFAFITNAGDNSLTQVDFQACHNSTIPSFTEVTPPTYSYDSPGVYNIYFSVNQGLPNAEVDCKAITVLPKPALFINTDTTLCQGDTIHLYAISDYADSIRWQNTYAIDTTNLYADSVRVFPKYSTSYNVVLYYPDGCIVDTSVYVNVSNVLADAGPDRYITDGSSTVLGGPNTTTNGLYSYLWTPFQYLTDPYILNTVATPPYTYTYYLTVTELNDGYQCKSTDTVVVYVDCGTFNLPNAFAPNSESSATNSFGILNNQIVKLNYFRIYNRWGNLVFETTDPFKKWDGTYDGKPAPSDVYTWEADGFCESGRIKRTGNVTLLR